MSKPKPRGYILVAKGDPSMLVYGRIFQKKNEASDRARILRMRFGVDAAVLEIHARDQVDATSGGDQ